MTLNRITLSVKRSEALTQAATWVDLEHTMLSERSQTQKDTQCVIPLIGNVQNRQIHRDKKGDSWLSGAGGGGWGVTFHGDGVSLGGWEGLREVMFAQHCESPKCF